MNCGASEPRCVFVRNLRSVAFGGGGRTAAGVLDTADKGCSIQAACGEVVWVAWRCGSPDFVDKRRRRAFMWLKVQRTMKSKFQAGEEVFGGIGVFKKENSTRKG